MAQYFEVNKMPLHVLTNNGFDVTMGVNIKETDLLRDNSSGNAPTFSFNSGDTGIEFECSVVNRETYFFKGKQCSEWLNRWSKNQEVINVVTNAMDIPNGKYRVQVKTKKQKDKNKSIWKLRFKQFYEDSSSFDNLYTMKTASLSPVDTVLSRYREINSSSPSEAILALQQKLQQLGYLTGYYTVFKNNKTWLVVDNDGEIVPRVPNGKWDSQMTGDIFSFQADHYMSAKQGLCDWETISDLIGMTRKSSIYDVGA